MTNYFNLFTFHVYNNAKNSQKLGTPARIKFAVLFYNSVQHPVHFQSLCTVLYDEE